MLPWTVVATGQKFETFPSSERDVYTSYEENRIKFQNLTGLTLSGSSRSIENPTDIEAMLTRKVTSRRQAENF